MRRSRNRSACVVNGQTPLQIGEGDTVVVIGAGAIGLMHGQLARAKGASRVFIVDVSPNRLKMAEAHGFDQVIDGSASDPVEEVHRLTDGLGATVAITATSAGVAAEQAVEMVGERGGSAFRRSAQDQPQGDHQRQPGSLLRDLHLRRERLQQGG